MDAQGNVEAVTARLSASPSEPITVAEGAKDVSISTPSGIRSSPPAWVQDVAMDSDAPNGSVEDAGVKSDSEAETIVLPEKDGQSPSKIRKSKSIKHEDKSDNEEMGKAPDVRKAGLHEIEQVGLGDKPSESSTTTATSTLGKRKRSKHGHGHGNGNGNGNNTDEPAHLGNSSGLSSVPTSPVATTRSSLSKAAASDSDSSKSPSSHSHSTIRDKAKSVDRVLPRGRQNASDSEEEGEGEVEGEGESEIRRVGRQRSSGGDQKPSKDIRPSSKLNVEANSRKRTRSTSPHARSHRRSLSTQLPSKSSNGLSHKKKRVPTPIQSTDYQSDESSASGSSHPQSSRLRSLAAPTTGESTISPVKMPPHRRLVNPSGQTWLAQACNKGDLDKVRQRLEERPDDLDVGDNAFNTPLHFASIAGRTPIVQLLLDAGCIVDCVNLFKDTPLHDALENGHVDVVKLLLDAGANPRKPNAAGEEPRDLVEKFARKDEDNAAKAAEMRELILTAKQRNSELRPSLEDGQLHDNADSRLSHSNESPRQTSPGQSHESQVSGGVGRKFGTTRSVKTSDRLLYQGVDLNTLRDAASTGAWETVARILSVNTHNGDPETLILAAKGGHDEIVGVLFAIGDFNPDPDPLEDMEKGIDTPILAAIGRHNTVKVIDLFVKQEKFNPTKLHNGKTYYEIAKARKGPAWKEEEVLLKEAYENYQKKRNKSSPNKTRSPGLRRDGREEGRDARRLPRDEQQGPRSHKRSTSSPKAKESDASRSHKRKSSEQSQDGQGHSRRGPGRPRKEESSSAAVILDCEAAPLRPPKQKSQPRRSEFDTIITSPELETGNKPRRKLVSGKELRGERELEKQRRASMASNVSSVSLKDGRDRSSDDTKPAKLSGRASPSVQRTSKNSSTNQNEHEFIADRSHSDKDKARSLKRDDSKDRLTAIRGESPVKRPRKSETPPRSGMQEIMVGYLAGGAPQKRRKLETDSASENRADSTPSSSPDHHMGSVKPGLSHERMGVKSSSDTKDKAARTAQTHVEELESSKASRIGEKAPKITKSSSKVGKSIPGEAVENVLEEDSASIISKAEEEREAQLIRQNEELETMQQREAAEKAEQERIEKAKQAREAREKAAREEELRRLQEDAERKERQKQEDAEAHARAVEEQKRLYIEQERLKREEQERRRAIALEQQRAERARIEAERRIERLGKLPLLLRWLDMAEDPKTHDIAARFRYIEGIRYDTIKPEATGHPNGREQWMLNTHVTILLGEKDLQLSRYTAWERIPLSLAAKKALWRTENSRYCLTHQNLAGLRSRMLRDNGEPRNESKEKNKALFLDLDLFFVKVSEFMFVVPNFPHLRGIEMVVNYRELIESDVLPLPDPKWKQDPDIDSNQTFKPQPKYYINGNFVRQGEVPHTRVSTTPFPEKRVPRRELVEVLPGESDYEELCKKQGLFHLLPGYQAGSPNNQHQGVPVLGSEQTNGITPPNSDQSKSVNGGSPHHRGSSEAAYPNGIGESVGMPKEAIL